MDGTMLTDHRTSLKLPFETPTEWEINSTADPLLFRSAMRKYVGGVTVVTTRHLDRPWGMTVSAFTPACMEPPTLLACVNRETITASNIEQDGRFAINILSENQIDVSQYCSRPKSEKFIEEYIVADHEVPTVRMPVLRGSLITFDCDVLDTFSAGSHFVVLASVQSILAPPALKPLLYGGGQYMQGVAVREMAPL